MTESKLKLLVIIGAGGLGREVASLVNDINKESITWDLIGFIDDRKKGQTVEGYPIIGKFDDVFELKPTPAVVIAIADSAIRLKMFERLMAKGVRVVSVVHPSVVMSDYVDIGEGTIICAGSVITTNVKLGKACIINPNCFVGHDSGLSDFVSLMPGANIAGDVTVGEGTYLGLNSTVINKVKIGAWSTIGAGAAVVKDLPDHVTAVGVPAKIIKSTSSF